MSRDENSGSRHSSVQDVRFRPAGEGMSIMRCCNGRKGAWLCGAKISTKGLCDGCEKAKQERQAKAAA